MSFDPRMIFGFAMLALISALAFAIALGKVRADESAGLDAVLHILGVLAGGFAQWAFAGSRKE